MSLFHIVTLFCLVAVCSAHLCLINPIQRGSETGINKPGAADCLLLTAPCGGRSKDKAGVTLTGGQSFTVVFQKNLDHWIKATPGNFVISFGMEGGQLTTLATVMDNGEPSLTLYETVVTIPMMKGNFILQVTYNPNNPQAPAHFYQCADVHVI
ncbi:hypothetical protein ACJMK2_008883 [Sinanodonta woodiana]|uniref:Uncharacterized protein n=1 Tax=Sinanodonta woodiana TaxID=1069815 RepID=A0ABD3VAK0_SINWO